MAVDLPFATRRQRETAAPFAVEGLIGQPLDQVHIALGAEISERRHLCGIVRRDVMARWVEILDRAGLSAAIVVPDALILPTPGEGMWRVAMEGGRALVRSGDATGFAIDADSLAMAWEAAGRPDLTASSTDLPESMRAGVRDMTFDMGDAARPVMVIPPLDLRQGDFAAVRRRAAGSPARTAAWIVGLGMAAHLVIFGVDTLALHLAADRAEAGLRAALSERMPGRDVTDLMAAVDVAAPMGVANEGAFTAVMGRASQALAGSGLAFRAIDYSADAPLQLAVTAPNAEALDNGVSALDGRGFNAERRLDPVEPGMAAPGGVNAALIVTTAGGAR